MRFLAFVATLVIGVFPLQALAGSPHIIAGVDFDNYTYRNYTCGDYPHDIQLDNGKYYYSGEVPDVSYEADYPLSTSISHVWSGRVSGTPVAIVNLYCKSAHAYEQEVRVFSILNRRARYLGRIGRFSVGYMVGGTDIPMKYPSKWIFITFAGGRFYADVWAERHPCAKLSDWTSSTYTIRSGALFRPFQQKHHRREQPLYCS